MATTTALCPGSKSKGKKVGTATLQSLVRDEFRRQIDDAEYYFCQEKGCEVVYFAADGRTITKPQLKVEVGVKETVGERPLCYCFGHSVASIKAELLTLGKTTAVEDIRTRMADQGCSCPTVNPSGSCCLVSVKSGVEVAKREVAAPGGGGKSGGLLTQAGAVLSAAVASSCCWLPLVLLAFGVSGAGIAGALETYRPAFLVLTFGFLAAGFYFAYRPRKTGAAVQDCCERTHDRSTAPAPASKRPVTLMTFHKVMLWCAAALAVALLFFPNYVTVLLGGSSSGDAWAENSPLRKTSFKVTGMSCEGCSVLVAKALREVPGVRDVKVDYGSRRATVSTEACCPVPVAAILRQLERAGYRGEIFVTDNP